MNRFSSCLSLISAWLRVASALDHIDEVVHHATLAAHDEVEVAQADVEVDDSGFVAPHREARGKTGARRGFTHAAFAGSHHNKCVS